MSDLYTTISLTGEVATLLNRDAMLSASVSVGTTILPIGDSYMDRDTSTIVVFPDGGTLSVGTESLTVVGTPPSTTSITITPALSNSYPIYTPVLRTDHFDVATNIGTTTISTQYVSSTTYAAWATGRFITVDNPPETDDYPVRVYLDYASEMNTDFSDIRFTTISDASVPYWIESYTPSASAIVSVAIPSNTETFCVIYGNESAVSESSGSDTFIYFEDFLGTSVDTEAWDISGIVSVADSLLTISGTKSGYSWADMINAVPGTGSRVITANVRHSHTGPMYGLESMYVFQLPDWEPYYTTYFVDIAGNEQAHTTYTGSTETQLADLSNTTQLQWKQISYHMLTDGMKIYCNDNQDYATTGTTGDYAFGMGFSVAYLSQLYLDVDWIYVRPGQDVEPVCTVGGASREITTVEPGTIRVGMEEVTFSSVDNATDHARFYIQTRGANAYPHTEWAPVTDAAYTPNNPATDSEIGRWGVIESVDYHHGALDQNTLDIHALDKLMDATRPEFGRVEMTGMDVWQDAYYTYKKDITYYVTSPTAFATVRFEVYTTTGTDSASKVYIGDTIQKTWWDIRFVTSGMQNYYLATFGTQSATVWLKIKDPATGGATVSIYFGSPMAIDYTLPATPTGFSVATLGSWSATSTGTFNIGDRGFATVREGDAVNVVELDNASRLYNVSGMIYDQRAGTLTMEIGKPQEYALTDMVKPFRTRDILSTQNL